jgi:hypothetical protein
MRVFSLNDAGLLNFRFERVAANSFIQAARMYRGRDVQFGAAVTSCLPGCGSE